MDWDVHFYRTGCLVYMAGMDKMSITIFTLTLPCITEITTSFDEAGKHNQGFTAIHLLRAEIIWAKPVYSSPVPSNRLRNWSPVCMDSLNGSSSRIHPQLPPTQHQSVGLQVMNESVTVGRPLSLWRRGQRLIWAKHSTPVVGGV